jgi:hypothetical protein
LPTLTLAGAGFEAGTALTWAVGEAMEGTAVLVVFDIDFKLTII